MSELNNTFKVSNKQLKEKKPFEKKFRIFVIVISIILIGVTAGLIVLKRNEVQILPQGPIDLGEVPEAGELATTDLDPLKLTDKFYYNGIKVKYTQFNQNKIPGTQLHKFNASYAQISGLKDKNVQDKINQDLKSSALNFYQKSQMQDETIESVTIDQSVMGNFADILSISMTYHVLYKDSNDDILEFHTLNYSLKDGEYFEFEDCFLETASIKKILTQAYYKSMVAVVAEQTVGEYREFMDLSEIDHSAIERKTLEFMNEYNKNGIKSFSVSTNTIYIYSEDGYININMADFYESIAIYQRFLSKNLYEQNKEEKFFVFNISFEEPYYAYLKQERDNLFVELKIDFFEEYIEEGEKKDRALKLINEAKTKMLLKMEEYKQTAKDNPEKGYILQMSYMPYVGEDESEDYIYGDIYEYNMDYEYFKENVPAIIAEGHRRSYGEYIPCVNYAENNKNIKLKTTYDEIRLEVEEEEEIENEVTENVIDNTVSENLIVNENVVDIENSVNENIVNDNTTVETENETIVENVTE